MFTTHRYCTSTEVNWLDLYHIGLTCTFLLVMEASQPIPRVLHQPVLVAWAFLAYGLVALWIRDNRLALSLLDMPEH